MPVSPSRFALFYALYFALLGCIAPFWGLYLKHLSFTAVEIGSLMALFGVVRILAPNMWAAQSRRFRGPVQMVQWLMFLLWLLSLIRNTKLLRRGCSYDRLWLFLGSHAAVQCSVCSRWRIRSIATVAFACGVPLALLSVWRCLVQCFRR